MNDPQPGDRVRQPSTSCIYVVETATGGRVTGVLEPACLTRELGRIPFDLSLSMWRSTVARGGEVLSADKKEPS